MRLILQTRRSGDLVKHLHEAVISAWFSRASVVYTWCIQRLKNTGVRDDAKLYRKPSKGRVTSSY